VLTYYEYLAVLPENAPVAELERLKKELSGLPKVQKDGLWYIDTTAAQEFLALPHEKYGNLANYLLILLSENIAMPVAGKSGSL